MQSTYWWRALGLAFSFLACPGLAGFMFCLLTKYRILISLGDILLFSIASAVLGIAFFLGSLSSRCREVDSATKLKSQEATNNEAD